jgi:diguanylate cyclase (GGDEF)-like protein
VYILDIKKIDSLNQEKWNRRTLNNYWIVLVISSIGSSINILFTSREISTYIFGYIVTPALILIVLIALAEALNRYVPPQPYSFIILFLGAAIMFIFIYIHHTVRGIESLLLLPILSSCTYFRKNKIIFSASASLTFYLALILIHPSFEFKASSVITMTGVISFGGYIALKVMNRGFEILSHLEESIKSSQDLMVSKIMIERMAKTDVLTDMYNHRAFQEYSEDLLKHSRGTSLHLAVIDIDNFKYVNDTFGHQIGDIILKYTAKAIQDRLTENDFAARYGGEEFVVIFTDKSLEETLDRVEGLREHICQMTHSEINDQNITVSIGLHTYTHNMSKNQWFSGADQALYRAKQTGKNKVVIHQSENKTTKGECM